MVRQRNVDGTGMCRVRSADRFPNERARTRWHRVSTRATRERAGKPRAGAWGSEMQWMCTAAVMVFVVSSTLQSVARAAPAGGDPLDRLKVGPTQTNGPTAGPTDSDKKLGEKLIRQTHSNADEDVMDTMLRLMGSAAQRLEIELDAGKETQTLQRRIMDQLNDAIKMAGLRRRVRSRDQQPSRGDKRRRRQDKSQRLEKRAGANAEQQNHSSTETTDGGAARRDGDRDGGSLYESRRSWGQLPLREREEVIQGISERYLERFRTWIERYYRALQESDDSNTR